MGSGLTKAFIGFEGMPSTIRLARNGHGVAERTNCIALYIASHLINPMNVNSVAVGKCIDKLRAAICERDAARTLLMTVAVEAPLFLIVKVAV